MKQVAVILPYGYRLSSVAIVLDVFETANTICVDKKRDEPFKITIIQSPEQIAVYGRSFHGHPVRSINSNLKMDLILIPAFTSYSITKTIEDNIIFIPWLQKQFNAGAEVASFCTGAFLFAAAGLLNGKLATTHMDACSDFIVAFPKVFTKPGRTITVDEPCYTSGGSTSAFHLLVFLIQKYCGNEIAVRISKIFAIDLNRYQQTYFSTFRPDYSHNDDLVKKVQKKLEAGYLTINTIESIIKDFPASRRNIVRRFKHITGVPPIEYLQHIRIEKKQRNNWSRLT